MAEKQNVIIHAHVRSEESQVVAHVVKQAADLGGEMNYMCWPMLLEQLLRVVKVTKRD